MTNRKTIENIIKILVVMRNTYEKQFKENSEDIHLKAIANLIQFSIYKLKDLKKYMIENFIK